MSNETEQQQLYGDKALELFFGDNPSPVATAIWAFAMRNNYEDELTNLRERIAEKDALIAELQDALDGMRGIAKGRLVELNATKATLRSAQDRLERVLEQSLSNAERIAALTAERDALRQELAGIDRWELDDPIEEDEPATVEWKAPSGRTWKVDLHFGESEADNGE